MSHCPACHYPVTIPANADRHVDKCPLCGRWYEARQFPHSVQIELLDSPIRSATSYPASAGPAGGSRAAKKEPAPKQRDAAPAPVVWALRVISLMLVAYLPVGLGYELWAYYRQDARFAREGKLVTANVYSPYMYPLGPDDPTPLTYVYTVGEAEFRGKIRNAAAHQEPSFQIKTQNVKISKTGAAYVERSEELVSRVGTLSITYLPSDPETHRVGTVEPAKPRRTALWLLLAGLVGATGGLLARYFFSVEPARGRRSPAS